MALTFIDRDTDAPTPSTTAVAVRPSLVRRALSALALLSSGARGRAWAAYPVEAMHSPDADVIGLWGAVPQPDGDAAIYWVRKVGVDLKHGAYPADKAPSISVLEGEGRGPPLTEVLRALGALGETSVTQAALLRLRAIRPDREPSTDDVARLGADIRLVAWAFRATLPPATLALLGAASSVAAPSAATGAPEAEFDPALLDHPATKAAFDAYPELAPELAALWTAGEAALFGNPESAAVEALRQRPIRTDEEGADIGAPLAQRIVAALPDLRIAAGDLDNAVRRKLTEAVLDLLPRLPDEAFPSSIEEWSAFLKLAPALLRGMSFLRRGMPASEFIAFRNSWRSLLSRCAHALGLADPDGKTLDDAVESCLDAAESLARDVCAPALFGAAAASKEAKTLRAENRAVIRRRAMRAARDLLFGGRSFPKCLDAVAEWRVARARIEAAVRPLARVPEEEPPTGPWPGKTAPDCGYERANTDSWRIAHAAWAPLLPRRARPWSQQDMAFYVDRIDSARGAGVAAAQAAWRQAKSAS